MSTSEAVVLESTAAHALCAAVAHRAALDVGARPLLIKGPVLAAQGLRAPTRFADVDVMVEPAKARAVLARLAEVGWLPLHEDTRLRVVDLHSTTLRNSYWPVELDLHHQYPGFLAAPAQVFDALWRRRGALEIAHQRLDVTDRAGSILIAALHYVRNGAFHADRLNALAERVRNLLDDASLRDLAELAAETGCADTLRDFLDQVGAPPIGVGHSDPDALASWRLFLGSQYVIGIGIWDHLRRAPWSQRPGILVRGFLLTEGELRERFPGAPPGRRGVWTARWQRLVEGIRAMPKVRRLLREHPIAKH